MQINSEISERNCEFFKQHSEFFPQKKEIFHFASGVTRVSEHSSGRRKKLGTLACSYYSIINFD